MHRLLVVLLACLFLALPAWAMTVDLNSATQADLETLPGIGPAKATAIIEWREANGGFTDPVQLDDVPGIGPATLSRLLPLVAVDGRTVAGPAPSPSTSDAHATSSATPPPPSGDLGLQIQPAPAVIPADATVPAEAADFISPAPHSGLIDINTASADQLMALPGIGASKAALIAASREQQGSFASCADLQRVNGIGAKTVANLEHMCTTGGGSSARPSSGGGSSPPAPAYSGTVIDINSATVSQLDEFPGIGASKAAAIIADRDQNGPFASCADLQRVTGIGSATVAKLEHMCVAR